MAYGALAVIVWRYTRDHVARWTTVVLVAVVAFVVGASRIYQGMHGLSDTIGGALLGAATVALVAWVLRGDDAPVGGPEIADVRRSGYGRSRHRRGAGSGGSRAHDVS